LLTSGNPVGPRTYELTIKGDFSQDRVVITSLPVAIRNQCD